MVNQIAVPSQLLLEGIDDSERIFSGYASVEILDKQFDIVPIEEVERGLSMFMSRGGTILLGHTNKPIGKCLNWQIVDHPKVHAKAARLTVKLFDDYDIDSAVWRGIKDHTFKGFSIGATAKVQKMFKKDIPELAGRSDLPDEIHKLVDLSLLEVSIVENPANQLAYFDQINYIAKSVSPLLPYVSITKAERRLDRTLSSLNNFVHNHLMLEVFQFQKEISSAGVIGDRKRRDKRKHGSYDGPVPTSVNADSFDGRVARSSDFDPKKRTEKVIREIDKTQDVIVKSMSPVGAARYSIKKLKQAFGIV